MISAANRFEYGFIGAGNMVSAIVQGMSAAGVEGESLAITDHSGKRAPVLAKAVDATYLPDTAELIRRSKTVILGMKPHQQNQLLRTYREEIAQSQPLVISIAAGRSIAQLEAQLPEGTAVVRVMPNVAAQVGLSTTALCGGTHTSAEQIRTATALCEAIGSAQVVAEELFPVFTALAGCSPAWFAATVDALAQAGVAEGLTKTAALTAAASAMEGTGKLIQAALAGGNTAADIVDQVCSPRGTTVAGLLAAEDAGLRRVWHSAVRAAVARDAHLSAN
ncbi:pyrroline-5-carboxylate reductase [Boudabousia marimammalium]|uniref:Pyrroline-5-carboxylate reductase n=2 Tax=Boudabousia marimammalium TaxID=156892 RepID=A0A1Q5PP77_9ACTO|nr:pyrroline-5-carboxylate reductase [Boudabousia marimammalium]